MTHEEEEFVAKYSGRATVHFMTPTFADASDLISAIQMCVNTDDADDADVEQGEAFEALKQILLRSKIQKVISGRAS